MTIPTSIEIDGYGTTNVTTHRYNPSDRDTPTVVKMTVDKMSPNGTTPTVGPWELVLFPEEALLLAGALIERAREAALQS